MTRRPHRIPRGPLRRHGHFVRDGALISAVVSARRGDAADARRVASEVSDALHDVESASPWQAAWALARGDAGDARRIALAGMTQGGMSGPQHALWLVEALVDLANWSAVAALLPSARAAVPGNAVLDAVCTRAAGLVDARADRRSDAVGKLLAAAGEFAAMKMPFEAARTHEVLAALVPRDAAREHREAALAIYRRLRVAPRPSPARGLLPAPTTLR